MITKSKFLSFLDCPRKYYLDDFHPEYQTMSPSVERRKKLGTEVGLLAKQLFPGIKDVPYSDPLDMVQLTKELIQEGTEYIAEASFKKDDLFCSVDILKIHGKNIDLYEVKSSTSQKNKHIYDLSFQYHLLKQLGYLINKIKLIHINDAYILGDSLETNDLFEIEDLTNEVKAWEKHVNENIEIMRTIDEEPVFKPVTYCSECLYHQYCYQPLPEDSILNLYRFRKKRKLYDKGIRVFSQVPDSLLNDKQRRQVEYHYNDFGYFVDQNKLRKWLNQLEFPLYFLDFETLDYPIPRFKGTKPNQRLPYQASLHVMEKPGSNLIHHDILIYPDEDPRHQMAKFLTQYIDKGSVMVYYAPFEKSVIKDLMNQLPKYSDQLKKIHQSIVDLLDVFSKGMVYHKDMQGSFSIKKVYPAMVPEQKNAYINLSQVHNGSEAMGALESLPYQEDKSLDKALRAYCKLDTLSMVEIYNKIITMI